ncbi:MAG: hypothetical protein HWN65_06365 [Candidatus Helarchaeota archaeon]|nr:hypothetical protein [Candidatus Helarchaeota archaeon]
MDFVEQDEVYSGMAKIRHALFFVFLLVLGLSIFLGSDFKIKSPPSLTRLNATASGDPHLPDPLLNDVSVPEGYGAVADYYYITDNASPSYYHVIWTHAIDPSDAFDVFLYSDPDYSDFMTASVPAMSWVVARLSINQKLYPTVHTYSDAGNAYTEWEVVSDSLTRGATVSGILNDSEYVETYWVSLSEGYWYNLSLTVPPGVDFDLYIYHVAPGYALGGNNYAERSDDGGIGGDERIFWEASKTGPHAVILRAKSGAGSYTLEFRSPEWQYGGDGRPWYLIFVLLGIIAVAVIIAVIKVVPRRGKPSARTVKYDDDKFYRSIKL